MESSLDKYIKRLVHLDELQNWGASVPELKGEARRKAFSEATPLWVERMVNEGKLLLHPQVIEDLRTNGWVPNDLQRKMIWASIVCKLDRADQKKEKYRIRELIQKAYGSEWWEEIYDRAGKVWPAWDRFRKNILSLGPATAMLANNSSVIGLAMHDEFKNVLNMVPKN